MSERPAVGPPENGRPPTRSQMDRKSRRLAVWRGSAARYNAWWESGGWSATPPSPAGERAAPPTHEGDHATARCCDSHRRRGRRGHPEHRSAPGAGGGARRLPHPDRLRAAGRDQGGQLALSGPPQPERAAPPGRCRRHPAGLHARGVRRQHRRPEAGRPAHLRLGRVHAARDERVPARRAPADRHRQDATALRARQERRLVRRGVGAVRPAEGVPEQAGARPLRPLRRAAAEEPGGGRGRHALRRGERPAARRLPVAPAAAGRERAGRLRQPGDRPRRAGRRLPLLRRLPDHAGLRHHGVPGRRAAEGRRRRRSRPRTRWRRWAWCSAPRSPARSR